MNFDLLKLSALCNAVETKSATAEDKGEEDFGMRLTHDDAKMIVRGLLLLDKQQREFNAKAENILGEDKMTYEEALDWLMNKISIDVQNSRNVPKDIECLEMCKKALEKQIPKKPKEHYELRYGIQCGCYPVMEYLCPCCGRDVDYTEHHCVCGQTIDWSDVDG